MPRDADSRLQGAYCILGRIGRMMLVGCILTLSQVFLSESPAQTDVQKLQPFVLDGTQWSITLAYIDAKGKKQTRGDVLIFSNRKIISKWYEQKGYVPTNYSISARGDGVTTFGTMQIMKDMTSFWKGEIVEDGLLQGSLHVQDKEGNLKEYSVEGKLASGTLRRKGEKALEPESSSAETAVPSAAELSQGSSAAGKAP